MSGSEPGLMAANRELMPFPMGLHHHQQQHNQAPPQQQHNQAPPQQQHNQAPPQQQQSQNMQLSFAGGGDETAIYRPMSSTSSPPPPQHYQPNSAGAGNPALNMNMPMPVTGSEPVKKRRGRPRKYGPVSDGVSLGLVPGGPSFTVSQPSGDVSGEGTSPTHKRMRGRPSGSRKKQKLQALGSTGAGFTPHVLTVRNGEDVASKIMALSLNGPRAVCVLSANGSISNVTLRQQTTFGGTVTHEGRFEILSLSGSFHQVENNGHRSRTGGLSVCLSGPDGNVLGGSVAGLLLAASPVQIVVGSFMPDGQKERAGQRELSSPTAVGVAPNQAMMNPSSPQSRGTMSESSCGGHGSPLHQSSTGGPFSNTNLSMPWKKPNC